MKKEVLYDLTSVHSAIDSLGEYLNLSERQIGKYITDNKNTYNVAELQDYYLIDDDVFLESDISLVTLHVTTNNDECGAIKKYGLLNLQQTIMNDTPLGNYLKDQGVLFDIENKQVKYKDKLYSINKEHAGIKDSNKDFVPYKIYDDYQVNSFISYDNVLEYGVQNMPEFLHNLSDFLGSKDIGFNWWHQESKKCYVVKFKTALSNCANDTFYSGDDGALTSNDFEYLDGEELELLKRKWLVYQSLSIISNSIFSDITKEIFCQLNFDVTVPYSDIMKIYTASEYLEEYKIKR
ncbi:hypothetical protein [Cytobacillus firmus]|uniref:hypothetical protein n=1 Tax=Cytobacillus firmus TaxID=1399 RepID=UPI001CFD3195|nr:hypothetical protein [Cytobacillus firmus]